MSNVIILVIIHAHCLNKTTKKTTNKQKNQFSSHFFLITYYLYLISSRTQENTNINKNTYRQINKNIHAERKSGVFIKEKKTGMTQQNNAPSDTNQEEPMFTAAN